MEYLDRAETLKTFLNTQEQQQQQPSPTNGAAKTKKV
jgi:hypothetical protein